MTKTVEQQLNKLHKDLVNLLTDLDGYSEEKLNKQPSKDSWSVFQIMHHMALVEQVSIQYVERKLSGNPSLKKATVVTNLRKVMLSAYLSAPVKAKAPSAVGTEHLPRKSTFWEVAKKWKSQREELRKYLADLPEEYYTKEIYKHPFVGRVTIGGMLQFFQQHFDRHKKQIYRNLDVLDAVKIN